ncbi:MAG: hypothetical protein WCH76_06180 [Candidatus Riflemargulisbacteria bacterium]
MRNKIISISENKSSSRLGQMLNRIGAWFTANTPVKVSVPDTPEQKREKAILYFMFILDDYQYNPLRVAEDEIDVSSSLRKENNHLEICIHGKIPGEGTKGRNKFCVDLHKEITDELLGFGLIDNIIQDGIKNKWTRQPLFDRQELLLNFYLTDEGLGLADEAMKRLVINRNAHSQKESDDITRRPMLS